MKQLFLLCTLITLSLTAHAQIFRMTLIGANENPPVPTSGTGSSIIMINPTTHTMRVNARFTGLTSGTTAAHVHCCVVPTANAGVSTTQPTFAGTPLGVTSGSWDLIYDMTQAAFWNPAFITANGGTPASAEAALLAGAFSGLAYLNVHSVNFGGGEIRGTLVLQRFATSSTAGTSGAAMTLDALGAGTGAMSNALMTLAVLTPAQQNAALERLTPTPSNGMEVATTSSMTAAFDEASFRLDGLRMTDSGQYPVTVAAEGGESLTNGFWLKGYGTKSRQDLMDGFAGYNSNTWGLGGGFDHQFTSGLLTGVGLSYSDTELRSRDQLSGNSGDVTSMQLTLYATQDIGSLYVDGMLAYALQNYDSIRKTRITGPATGGYDGNQLGARIGGGMPLAISTNITITPQLRLDWISIKQDGYVEEGGALALNVAENSVDRVRSSLGAQLDYDMTLGYIKARPFLRAFWHHDFKNEGMNAAASFVGGGGSFITPGQKVDNNTQTLGVGANFYNSSYFSASVAYDATRGSSYLAHMMQAKVSWLF